jgi:hypothetical protein
LEVREEITRPFNPHLKSDGMLIYSNIGSISCHKCPELPLATVAIVTEKKNLPKLIYFVE